MLAVLIRTPFDQFGKQLVRTALATRGPVETDAEVPADTRRIDLWFTPDSPPSPVPDHLGLLGLITAGPSTLEFFHNTPNGDEPAGCLISGPRNVGMPGRRRGRRSRVPWRTRCVTGSAARSKNGSPREANARRLGKA